MSTSNPSLGHLSRLSAELRNRIYEIAADSSDEAADITKPCHSHNALALVSKQISRESIRFIIDSNNKPCQHRRLVFKMPETFTYTDKLDNYICGPLESPEAHNISISPVTWRFLTAHLGRDIPLAIVVKAGTCDATATFYGASAERTQDEKRFSEDFGNIILRYMNAPWFFEKKAYVDPEVFSLLAARFVEHLKLPPGVLRDPGKLATFEEHAASRRGYGNASYQDMRDFMENLGVAEE